MQTEVMLIIKYIFFLAAFGGFAVMSDREFQCDNAQGGLGWLIALAFLAMYYY